MELGTYEKIALRIVGYTLIITALSVVLFGLYGGEPAPEKRLFIGVILMFSGFGILYFFDNKMKQKNRRILLQCIPAFLIFFCALQIYQTMSSLPNLNHEQTTTNDPIQ